MNPRFFCRLIIENILYSNNFDFRIVHDTEKETSYQTEDLLIEINEIESGELVIKIFFFMGTEKLSIYVTELNDETETLLRNRIKDLFKKPLEKNTAYLEIRSKLKELNSLCDKHGILLTDVAESMNYYENSEELPL